MEKETKSTTGQGFGIAGLVLGIIAVVLAIIPCIGLLALIPGVTGIVLSAIGLSQISKTNAPKGLVIAALIISTLGTLFAPIWTITIAHKLKSKIENVANDIEKEGATLDSLNKSFEGDVQDINDMDKSNKVSKEDYDRLIKEYSLFLKDLEKTAKKAKAGDLNSITEFSTISVKVTTVASKIAKLATQLSDQQIKEFEKMQKDYDSIISKIDLKK